MSTLHHSLHRRLLRRISTSQGDGGIDFALATRRVQLLAACVFGALLVEILLVSALGRFTAYRGDQLLDALPPLLVTVVLSAVVMGLLQISKLPLAARMAIGISYVFSVVILVTIADLRTPWWAEGERMRGLPWVAMWVMLVPIVVPLGPRRAIARSVVLSITPVAVMFASVQWFGLQPAPVGAYLDLYLPCMLASGVAVIIARMMFRLTKVAHQAQMLGSYQLEEQIGAGGMGVVWRARHRMLVRPAAIKLIRSERLTSVAISSLDSVVSRFKREAQATASLRSPHTVELYDFGVSEDGTLFYVMELLDGLDLQKLVERFGPLPAERVIFLLIQMCDSLADAHASGLVHRDIKPANIYVCRMGQKTDFVKILDFGLVKSFVSVQEDLALTAEQSVIGTPAFLAPEALVGEKADQRLDIYSLGCVAYWLLTGAYVFDAISPLAMAVAHAKDDPIPVSERSELPIPGDLDRIILDCLAKDPGDRPQSAGELAMRLASCAPERAWTDQLAVQWWDRHLPQPG